MKTLTILAGHPPGYPPGNALTPDEEPARIGSDDLNFTPKKRMIQITNGYLPDTILCIVRTD